MQSTPFRLGSHNSSVQLLSSMYVSLGKNFYIVVSMSASVLGFVGFLQLVR